MRRPESVGDLVLLLQGLVQFLVLDLLIHLIIQRQALEEQLKKEKKIGEILIDQGAIHSEDVLRALDEIESLRAAFDPLCPLRRKLEEWNSVPSEKFASALSLSEKEGRTLVGSRRLELRSPLKA